MTKPADVVTLQVLFSAESAWIEKPGVYVLEEAYRQLVKNPLSRVEVIGYSSNDGKEDRNVQLAIGRAVSVKAYLVERGIEGSRIAVVSRANEAADDDRARNRRAEIRILPTAAP